MLILVKIGLAELQNTEKREGKAGLVLENNLTEVLLASHALLSSRVLDALDFSLL